MTYVDDWYDIPITTGTTVQVSQHNCWCQSQSYIPHIIFPTHKNNNCPLTASTDCIKWQLFQIFTCLYRKCPMLWCHLWPHQVRSTCAKLQGFWLVRLCCPCGSHDHLCCDVIYDLIKLEAHVQNCKASDWSDCVVLVGHMITYVVMSFMTSSS